MELLFKGKNISIYDNYNEEEIVIQRNDKPSYKDVLGYNSMCSQITNDDVIECIENVMDDLPYSMVLKNVEDYKKSNMYMEVKRCLA